MNSPLIVRAERDALIVSFAAPARTLSWAVRNGGFSQADHVVNQHVDGDDAWFCAHPDLWLERAVSALGLQGKTVGMATTAVDMKKLVQASLSAGFAEVTCLRRWAAAMRFRWAIRLRLSWRGERRLFTPST
jgi:adenosylcobinamide amidohydrolase